MLRLCGCCKRWDGGGGGGKRRWLQHILFLALSLPKGAALPRGVSIPFALAELLGKGTQPFLSSAALNREKVNLCWLSALDVGTGAALQLLLENPRARGQPTPLPDLTDLVCSAHGLTLEEQQILELILKSNPYPNPRMHDQI